MQLKKALTILFFIILIGCQPTEKEISYREPRFTSLPKEVIKNIKGFHSPFLSYETSILFLGKFQFSDTLIDLKKDSLYAYLDKARSQSIDPLNYNMVNTDSISASGLELKIGKKSISVAPFFSSQIKNYRPAFIVNNTNETKVINIKDNRLFGIQEAIDSSLNYPLSNQNIWFAISMFSPPMCGSGYWSIKIHPKEYAITLLPVYEGGIKTLIRTKIKINNSIFTSTPYEGFIEKNQFITKDSLLLKMDKPRIGCRKNYFFDSNIKELSYYFGK